MVVIVIYSQDIILEDNANPQAQVGSLQHSLEQTGGAIGR